MDYDWPGNVRELENVIERALVLNTADTLSEVPLPGGGGAREPSGGAVAGMGLADIDYPLPVLTKRIVEGLEREYLRKVLQRYEGSIQRSAEHARITRRSFFDKLRSYGIKKEEFKKKG
jgi:DNA-binding NtrC family response regulator